MNAIDTVCCVMTRSGRYMEVKIDARRGLMFRETTIDGKSGEWCGVYAQIEDLLRSEHPEVLQELGLSDEVENLPDICPTNGLGCGGCHNCR